MQAKHGVGRPTSTSTSHFEVISADPNLTDARENRPQLV